MRHEKEYYKEWFDTDNFDSFKKAVKYGFKKVFGHLDELTTVQDDQTLWNIIKKTGGVQYSCGNNEYGVSFDIDFGRNIYIAMWYQD